MTFKGTENSQTENSQVKVRKLSIHTWMKQIILPSIILQFTWLVIDGFIDDYFFYREFSSLPKSLTQAYITHKHTSHWGVGREGGGGGGLHTELCTDWEASS